MRKIYDNWAALIHNRRHGCSAALAPLGGERARPAGCTAHPLASGLRGLLTALQNSTAARQGGQRYWSHTRAERFCAWGMAAVAATSPGVVSPPSPRFIARCGFETAPGQSGGTRCAGRSARQVSTRGSPVAKPNDHMAISIALTEGRPRRGSLRMTPVVPNVSHPTDCWRRGRAI